MADATLVISHDGVYHAQTSSSAALPRLVEQGAPMSAEQTLATLLDGRSKKVLSPDRGYSALFHVVEDETRALFDDVAADKNIYEHIVFSYMAHIDELEISAIIRPSCLPPLL